MKIAIGNDHAAVEMKLAIKAHLEERGIEVIDMGTGTSESCDYPVYGEKVGRAVASGEADLGIAICGTGVGISMAAGKVKESAPVCAASPAPPNGPGCTMIPTCCASGQELSASRWQR